MKDRQERLKATDGSIIPGGNLGRYVVHNNKTALEKPGIEQFAISIKLKYFKGNGLHDENYLGTVGQSRNSKTKFKKTLQTYGRKENIKCLWCLQKGLRFKEI